MKRLVIALLVAAFFSGRAGGQPADSLRVFTQEEYFGWVLAYHPVVLQARLLDSQADALERQARGGFDPKLYADWGQKYFDEKDYFSIGEGGLKVPTWFGVELKGAYAVSDGIFLNPERNLPEAGQAILGLTVPLGRGLVIDGRRAALQQAQLMAKANEAERRAIVNNVLLEAAVAYWDWSVAYNQLVVFEEALQLTEQRFGAIVESFRQGDKPAIDTLETLIQLQTRRMDLNEARLSYQNASLQLSNYLWYEGQVPLEISERLRPSPLEALPLQMPATGAEAMSQLARFAHPEVQQYQVKLEQLDVDRRLAVEQFKPRLDVEYNLLGDGSGFISGANDANGLGNLLGQNYKWGLNFEFPLLLRKERGKLQMTKLKILDAEYGLQQKQLEVGNKVRAYYNELDNLRQQIDISIDNVANYQRLLDAEYQKFGLGESSIFLVNSREQKLIEARLKLATLRGKFFKNVNALDWAAGQLGQ